MANHSLYKTDFPAWAYQQAALLKGKKFDQIDWDEVIEEIEDMGNRHHDKLMSRMQVLIMHLLKWQFQPEQQSISISWQKTIKEQRRKIDDAFDDMPSLKADLNKPEWVQKAWLRSVRAAADETDLPKNTFPTQPIWTMEQILDDDFFPSVNQ